MSFWSAVTRFESAKVNPWIALRNALGVLLPLAAGVAIGQADGGLMAAIGALNVAYSDGADPYRHRARRMFAANILCALAVFGGGLCAHNPYLVIGLIALAAFPAGMMVAVSQAAADVANITLPTLIVFSAHPLTLHEAALSGLLSFGGGLLQTVFALALWPVRRYQPEQEALAAFYAELARTAAAQDHNPKVATEPPSASAESTNAQQTLASLYSERSVDAERYLALLSQAERIRLTLITLIRLRIRLSREPGNETATASLLGSFELASQTLASVGRSLAGRADVPAFTRFPALPPGPELSQAPSEATLHDASLQLDALAGQLRAASQMAAHATPGGSAQFLKQDEARRPKLRVTGALATLRANLTLKSAAFRHAVRLAVCAGIAEFIVHVTGSNRGYWMAMTVVIVLRPDFASTFSRGVLRLAGTFLGLGFATALFHLLSPAAGIQVALITLLTFVLRCYGPANYGIFVAALSALVVLLIALTGVEPGPVIAARSVNTCAGGAIALLAYWLWPTWERTLTPELLAQMLDAYRRYFQTVRDSYLNPAASFDEALDRTRLASRLARSNVEASVARLASEPRSISRVAALRSLLANSHRLIHAVMSLEAGLAGSAPAPARAEFRGFANAMDATLYYLAAAVRGSKIRAGELPDLRALHTALIQSGDPGVDRYALVNVETDRMTNSLNTLAGEILKG